MSKKNEKSDYKDIFDALKDRSEEVAKEMRTFNPGTSLLFRMRWDGKYKIRLAIPKDGKDWMRSYGVHWNVVPNEEQATMIGCPRVNWGDTCPICDAIDHEISTQRAKRVDFRGDGKGRGGILVQKTFLCKAYLLDVDLKTTKNAPDFGPLPSLRVFQFPAIAVAQKINGWLEDEDVGPETILHPEEGQIIRIRRDESIQSTYDVMVMGEKYPLTEEMMADPIVSLNMDEMVPPEREIDVLRYLEEHPDAPDFIINHLMAIPTTAKQITE